MKRITITGMIGVWVLILSTAAMAAETLKISDDWVRASIPGQKISAAYLTLTSIGNAKLTKVESDAAGTVEIHSMTMKDGVMQMRMVDTLELPAGKAVALQPGGLHLMLFDLKAPLSAGNQVKFKLYIEDAQGKTQVIEHISPIQASNEVSEHHHAH